MEKVRRVDTLDKFKELDQRSNGPTNSESGTTPGEGSCETGKKCESVGIREPQHQLTQSIASSVSEFSSLGAELSSERNDKCNAEEDLICRIGKQDSLCEDLENFCSRVNYIHAFVKNLSHLTINDGQDEEIDVET